MSQYFLNCVVICSCELQNMSLLVTHHVIRQEQRTRQTLSFFLIHSLFDTVDAENLEKKIVDLSSPQLQKQDVSRLIKTVIL